MAAGNDDLATFVRDALSRNLPRQEIQGALTKAGWRPEQINAAMRLYADVDFPIPVPRSGTYVSPREAFMYLMLFSMLYVTAYQLGSLVIQLINLAYPDELMASRNADYVRQGMRWAISSLIVSFPVFVFMSWLIAGDLRRDPTKRASPIRRWLTYLTLFIAATVLVGDVTTLVYNVLGGELTVRFVLKVLTVGVIAGSAFGYYLGDLRRDERGSPS